MESNEKGLPAQMRENLARLLGMVRGPEQVGLDGADAAHEPAAAAKTPVKKAAKRKPAAKKSPPLAPTPRLS